jgi:hypothetical protein
MTRKASFLLFSLDVSFGRGKPFKRHPPGNMWLGLIVESLAAQYGESNNKENPIN